METCRDGKSRETLIRRLSGDRVEDQSHGTRVVDVDDAPRGFNIRELHPATLGSPIIYAHFASEHACTCERRGNSTEILNFSGLIWFVLV